MLITHLFSESVAGGFFGHLFSQECVFLHDSNRTMPLGRRLILMAEKSLRKRNQLRGKKRWNL
jgi:hypothetical protein